MKETSEKDTVETHLLGASSSPHLSDNICIRKVMEDVLIALFPALFASFYFFGWSAGRVVLVCGITAMLTEYVMQKTMGHDATVKDISALLSGVLLAMTLPPNIPLWIAALGSVFAIAIVKQLFGGLGYNIFNPALAARAILLASWPVDMMSWSTPRGGTTSGIDVVTSATPLTLIRGELANLNDPVIAQNARHIIDSLSSFHALKNMFIGNIAGSLGETSAFLILLGGIYLLVKKIIDWRIPVGVLGSVFVMSLMLGQNPFFNLLSGGVMLGAFFMATDYVTCPITPKGRWIFSVSIGVLTVLIRYYGGYPEGVCYSILILNMFSPMIERYTRTKPFGIGIK